MRISKRHTLVLALATVLLVFGAAVPAAGDNGEGELRKSFNAGLSGGAAVLVHNPVWIDVSAPEQTPEGRLLPYGSDLFVCDQQLVGTWVRWIAVDRDDLDAATMEFKLDGEVLETVRTPNKRVAQENAMSGPEVLWWFAEGVPVLGTLDPGLHDLEFSFDDGFGTSFTENTAVEVDSAHC